MEALSRAILAEKDSTQWKYAILNLVQAIELSLKELLRRQHPSLIYKDVDKQTETVSLKFARSRLEQIAGIKFEKTDLDSIQTASEYELSLIPTLTGPVEGLGLTLNAHKSAKSVLVLIGPEGDFSKNEVALALEQGAKPVSLGPLVLRSETAALYVLSTLDFYYREVALEKKKGVI